MRTPSIAALAAIFTLTLFGVSTSKLQAQHSRRSPIVEAVQKTRPSIATVRVEKVDGTEKIMGTAVVVDERGYLVTSRHVIATAVKVRIGLMDGTLLPAQIVAHETRTDLAILRVKPSKPLPALPLGPSSDLMVGETVIAVGNPYGYTNTVSTGIISALNRSIDLPSGDTLTGVIQINASINPGNSGGPVMNINGEFIGVTAAIRDGAQGIAFAVNADMVKEMLHRNLSSPKVANITHGLTCSERVAEDGPRHQSVIVTAVAPETPAANAGLKQGDVILDMANRPVANRFDVERSLWDCKPGDQVTLKVIRQQKEMAVALTLTARTAMERTAAVPASAAR